MLHGIDQHQFDRLTWVALVAAVQASRPVRVIDPLREGGKPDFRAEVLQEFGDPAVCHRVTPDVILPKYPHRDPGRGAPLGYSPQAIDGGGESMFRVVASLEAFR